MRCCSVSALPNLQKLNLQLREARDRARVRCSSRLHHANSTLPLLRLGRQHLSQHAAGPRSIEFVTRSFEFVTRNSWLEVVTRLFESATRSSWLEFATRSFEFVTRSFEFATPFIPKTADSVAERLGGLRLGHRRF